MSDNDYLLEVILIAANFINTDKEKINKVNIATMSSSELYKFMVDILCKVPNNHVSEISLMLFGFELNDVDDIIYLLGHKNKNSFNF